MPSISTALQSLGNLGARTNAQAALDRWAREEWLVAGLVRRIEAHEREGARISAPSVSARGA